MERTLVSAATKAWRPTCIRYDEEGNRVRYPCRNPVRNYLTGLVYLVLIAGGALLGLYLFLLVAFGVNLFDVKNKYVKIAWAVFVAVLLLCLVVYLRRNGLAALGTER